MHENFSALHCRVKTIFTYPTIRGLDRKEDEYTLDTGKNGLSLNTYNTCEGE